jgi:hypothetical protein
MSSAGVVEKKTFGGSFFTGTCRVLAAASETARLASRWSRETSLVTLGRCLRSTSRYSAS